LNKDGQLNRERRELKMVRLINPEILIASGGTLKFLADSKEVELPTEMDRVEGVNMTGPIRAGSICFTPALDMCIMANDETWGPWL